MKKYLEIMQCEWKNSLAYRGDVWLSAFFSVFRILLVYLLWSAVYSGGQLIGGLNLREMTTYYLIGLIISPITQGAGLLYDFAEEVRTGQYAKYIVRPISPLYYYSAASFARQILPTFMGFIMFSVVSLIFNNYFIAVSFANILITAVVCILAMILNMLISYIISTLSFKFTNIAGFYLLTDIIKVLLSGSLIPLNLFLGSTIPMIIPFSYASYFPAMICLGKSGVSPAIAVSVLAGWILLFYVIAKRLEKSAPKHFEAVGL